MYLFGVFWSIFSRIRAEYGGFQSNSLYSLYSLILYMQENADQKNSEYEHTFHAVLLGYTYPAKIFLVN